MTHYAKYPRTAHFPWSRGYTPDDIVHNDNIPTWISELDVVVTEKLDGENTNMYHDHIHARSMDSIHHPSREWVKALWGQISWQIPENMKICGENVYAKHSIYYDRLTSFFYVFGVCEWSNQAGEYRFIPWDEVEAVCEMLGLETVPVLYKDHDVNWKDLHKKSWTGKSAFGDEQEGYVVRCAGDFLESQFELCVAKFVRENHVQTDEFWMKNWFPNKMLARI
jgi:hypothetical protein